jgi:hypothetical protein
MPAAEIPLTPIRSSLIEAIGHDGNQTLAIRFRGKAAQGTPQPGPLYHYDNVAPGLHADLVAAESVGQTFLSVIKIAPDLYPATKIEPVAEKETDAA